MWNNGTGQFASTLQIPTAASPFSVKVGDVSGDGLPDIVTSNINSDSISILRNQGGGAFQAHVDLAAGDEPLSIGLANFDSDGLLDVVTANGAPSLITVFMHAPLCQAP
jgi:hypothetical protein